MLFGLQIMIFSKNSRIRIKLTANLIWNECYSYHLQSYPAVIEICGWNCSNETKF